MAVDQRDGRTRRKTGRVQINHIDECRSNLVIDRLLKCGGNLPESKLKAHSHIPAFAAGNYIVETILHYRKSRFYFGGSASDLLGRGSGNSARHQNKCEFLHLVNIILSYGTDVVLELASMSQ